MMKHFDTDESKEESMPLSFLFNLDTMELVQDFDYDYVSDFTMIDEDRKFLLATWQGTYMGDV